MFRKLIPKNKLKDNILESDWFSFEVALKALPKSVIISPIVATGTEEGKKLWLEQELSLIEYSYSEQYPLQWHGTKYLTSVTVPEESDPYEESYTDLAFALVQDNMVYFFARNEAVVNAAVAKAIQNT